jgi:hypothetical protein
MGGKPGTPLDIMPFEGVFCGQWFPSSEPGVVNRKGVYTHRLDGEYVAAAVFGRVAELADAQDLGSCGVIRAGSTPVAPTI